MLIEAAKGGHTMVVQMLIDFPNSLVSAAAQGPAALVDASSGVGGVIVEGERVPPPGSEATPPPTKVCCLIFLRLVKSTLFEIAPILSTKCTLALVSYI